MNCGVSASELEQVRGTVFFYQERVEVGLAMGVELRLFRWAMTACLIEQLMTRTGTTARCWWPRGVFILVLSGALLVRLGYSLR